MKFKITEITTSSVKVQYEDGSWEIVEILGKHKSD